MSEAKKATSKRPRNPLAPRFLNTPNAAVDVALLGAALFVGFLGSYAIYQSGWFYANALVGVVLGAALVFLVAAKKLPKWVAGLTWVGVYIVVGSILVGPGNESSFVSFARRVFGVVSAPVTGWKNILSLQIPLGTYHEVLAPVFFISFAAATVAFGLAWKSKKWWALAGATPFLPLTFGILFGSSSAGTSLPVLGVGGWRWLLGVFTVLISFAWLTWRPLAFRRKAKTQLVDAHGENVRGRWVVSRVTRVALGTGMLALALAASSALAPTLVRDRTRDVLRTNIDPSQQITAQVSPLSTIRQYYSDEYFDRELLRFDSEQAVDRIRLATLTDYDGNSYHLPGEAGEATFNRLPSFLAGRNADAEGAQSGEVAAVDMEILGYEGAWVPLPGFLVSIDFEGPDREALADGFFYSPAAETGVEVASPGLVEGVTYQVRVEEGTTDAAVASFQASGEQTLQVEVPESMVQWIDSQEVGQDGVGLTTLVERIRERGYLSHGTVADEGGSKWVSALSDYDFAPSRSGHSLDRMDRLFTKLLEQEEAAGEDAPEELLVSMIGDEEQFAVAASLIAGHLGYQSRVVLGFRTAPDPLDPTLTHCTGGVCRGGDITAWVEIQDAETGVWAALDVTPQYEMSPAPKIEQQSDPKHHTEVTPKEVETLPPPQAEPQTSDAQIETQEEDTGLTATQSKALKIVGIVALSLLVLALPVLTILGLKRIRVFRRKRAPLLGAQIVGAWASYVDDALDAGLDTPESGTRREVAEALSPRDEYAQALAESADYVTFSAEGPKGYDSAAVWGAYQTASGRFLANKTTFERLKAKLSLRSLLYWGHKNY